MKIKTYHDGKEWLDSLGVNLIRNDSEGESVSSAVYLLPKDSGRKTALAHLLIHQIFSDKALIFVLLEHGIWPSSENEFLFFKYRGSVSEEKDIDEYPFHYAEPQEAIYIEGLFALCLYFIWGAALLDDRGDVVIEISHDEWIRISSPKQENLKMAVKFLEEFGLVKL